MVRITFRIPDDVHEKLRWLAFKQRRSQHSIVMELLEQAVAKIEVPQEVKR